MAEKHTPYTIIAQARERVAKRTADERDELLVASYKSTGDSLVKIRELQALLDTAQSDARQYAHALDIARSQLAKQRGTLCATAEIEN